MESEIKLESFTTRHIILLIRKEFSHLLCKEDQNELKDIFIIMSQIYRRAFEMKDPLYFHINLIYEGLVGIDNTGLLRKYGIAIANNDFPIEDSSIVYLHNFFLNCYICAITVSFMNYNTSDEGTISTLFMQLVNEEKERLGINEAVDNVYSLCEMMSKDISVNNALIIIVTLLNPLNANYFQDELIRDIDNGILMNQGVKEFLKYLIPPKDFDQLEDLIINVNCFSDFCKKINVNAYDAFNYLRDNSALDNFQIQIIYFHTLKELNQEKIDSTIQNDMIDLIINISKNQKKEEQNEDQKTKEDKEITQQAKSHTIRNSNNNDSKPT